MQSSLAEVKEHECKSPASGLQLNQLDNLRNTAVLQIAGREARCHPTVCSQSTGVPE